MVKEPPGLDLPAEIGLSGKVVLRFAGMSRRKSGSTTGFCKGQTRGIGELDRDAGAAPWPFKTMRPAEGETPASEDVEFRRVGVVEREFE